MHRTILWLLVVTNVAAITASCSASKQPGTVEGEVDAAALFAQVADRVTLDTTALSPEETQRFQLALFLVLDLTMAVQQNGDDVRTHAVRTAFTHEWRLEITGDPDMPTGYVHNDDGTLVVMLPREPFRQFKDVGWLSASLTMNTWQQFGLLHGFDIAADALQQRITMVSRNQRLAARILEELALPEMKDLASSIQADPRYHQNHREVARGLEALCSDFLEEAAKKRNEGRQLKRLTP